MLAQAAPVVEAARDPRALLAVLPLAVITLAAYGRWIKLLPTRGGRVSTAQWGIPDLLVTVALGLLCCLIGALTFLIKEMPPLTVETLQQDVALKVGLLVLLGGFLVFRGMNLGTLFGLRELSLPKVVGNGLLFLLAAMPAMAAFGGLIEYLNGHESEQHVVRFFRQQVASGETAGILMVFVTAAIVAPLAEEVLFRGYFYPTLKRYLGPLASGVAVSLLFAVTHGNAAALLPLFVLALCFTVAYEWTGSLLVTITMHAIFNSISLAAFYYEVLHPK